MMVFIFVLFFIFFVVFVICLFVYGILNLLWNKVIFCCVYLLFRVFFVSYGNVGIFDLGISLCGFNR